MKKVLKIILISSMLINSAGQGYALRPMADRISKKPAGHSLADKEDRFREIKKILAKVKYRDSIVTSEDLWFEYASLTLTTYCDNACPGCFAHFLPLRQNQPMDPFASISDRDLERFLDTINNPEKTMQSLLITGDGEPFLEFEKLLHIIKNAKVRKITIKTNGLWAGSKQGIEYYLSRISQAAEENQELEFIVILLSADEPHNNINETVMLADSYLKHRAEKKRNIVCDKMITHISCMGSLNFEDYWDRLRRSLRQKNMDVVLELRGAGKNQVYFVAIRRLDGDDKIRVYNWPIQDVLPQQTDRNAVLWMANFPLPTGKAYPFWDKMRQVWKDFYDFFHKILKARKIKVPILYAPSKRDPYTKLRNYVSDGLPPGELFYRYNGSVMVSCVENELLSIGNLHMPEDDLLNSANNNPFIRAIKERRMKDILQSVKKIRPELIKKIPFEANDVMVMDWLLDQGGDLAGYILDGILQQDYKDGHLTSESAEALGLKSSSAGSAVINVQDSDYFTSIVKAINAGVLDIDMDTTHFLCGMEELRPAILELVRTEENERICKNAIAALGEVTHNSDIDAIAALEEKKQSEWLFAEHRVETALKNLRQRNENLRFVEQLTGERANRINGRYINIEDVNLATFVKYYLSLPIPSAVDVERIVAVAEKVHGLKPGLPTILDVGTGKGFLAYLLARTGRVKVIAIDESAMVEFCRFRHPNLSFKRRPVQQYEGQVDLVLNSWMDNAGTELTPYIRRINAPCIVYVRDRPWKKTGVHDLYYVAKMKAEAGFDVELSYSPGTNYCNVFKWAGYSLENLTFSKISDNGGLAKGAEYIVQLRNDINVGGFNLLSVTTKKPFPYEVGLKNIRMILQKDAKAAKASSAGNVENPCPLLKPGYRLTTVRIFEELLSSKYGIRNIMQGGPISQPTFFRAIKRDPSKIKEMKAEHGLFVNDISYDPQLANRKTTTGFKTLMTKVFNGNIALPLVFKPNHRGLGRNVFFLERNKNNEIVITMAYDKNGQLYTKEAKEVKEYVKGLQGTRVRKYSKKNIIQFTIPYRWKASMRKNMDMVNILYNIWHILSKGTRMTIRDDEILYDSGVVETLMLTVKYKGRAYETRHWFTGNLLSGECVLLKEGDPEFPKDEKPLWGKIGSSKYFGNQSHRSDLASGLKRSKMFKPLYEMYNIIKGSQAEFEKYAEDKIKEGFLYLTKRLKAAGIYLDWQAIGRFDLAWLPPSEDSSGFPTPVLIEVEMVPTNKEDVKEIIVGKSSSAGNNDAENEYLVDRDNSLDSGGNLSTNLEEQIYQWYKDMKLQEHAEELHNLGLSHIEIKNRLKNLIRSQFIKLLSVIPDRSIKFLGAGETFVAFELGDSGLVIKIPIMGTEYFGYIEHCLRETRLKFGDRLAGTVEYLENIKINLSKLDHDSRQIVLGRIGDDVLNLKRDKDYSPIIDSDDNITIKWLLVQREVDRLVNSDNFLYDPDYYKGLLEQTYRLEGKEGVKRIIDELFLLLKRDASPRGIRLREIKFSTFGYLGNKLVLFDIDLGEEEPGIENMFTVGILDRLDPTGELSGYYREKMSTTPDSVNTNLVLVEDLDFTVGGINTETAQRESIKALLEERLENPPYTIATDFNDRIARGANAKEAFKEVLSKFSITLKMDKGKQIDSLYPYIIAEALSIIPTKLLDDMTEAGFKTIKISRYTKAKAHLKYDKGTLYIHPTSLMTMGQEAFISELYKCLGQIFLTTLDQADAQALLSDFERIKNRGKIIREESAEKGYDFIETEAGEELKEYLVRLFTYYILRGDELRRVVNGDIAYMPPYTTIRPSVRRIYDLFKFAFGWKEYNSLELTGLKNALLKNRRSAFKHIIHTIENGMLGIGDHKVSKTIKAAA